VDASGAPYRVRFADLRRESRCLPGETLYQCARRAGVRIVGACGARGVCGTCLVRVTRGAVDMVSPAANGPDGWLRACLVRAATDCEVALAPRSLAPVVRAEVEGREAPVAVEPLVRAIELSLEAPRLGSAQADADRVIAALGAPGAARIDLEALRALPARLRAAGWRARAWLRGDEIIAVVPREARGPLGLAVDLGTTNVAGFLVDLASGRRLASLGIENPQTAFGADLVSRVNHAAHSAAGARELQAAAAAAVTALARDLCDAVGANSEDIAEIALCGNTAMHHLALGLPAVHLARAPFAPAVCGALDVKARELGFAAAPGACAHFMPNIGGFVGGDHVAALLATEARWTQASAIVMDIGTNTEVSLVHGGEITTVSCPSGPALEGGHIGCGMRAAEGAVERVRLQDHRLVLTTIGDAPPIGLCGSGVIDAVAALLDAGIADRRGRIAPGHAAVRQRGAQREVVLAPEVAFGQGDVRAVQLAKAAIRSGIDLLLAERGLAPESLDRLLIAGAFGAYLDVSSAMRIGLLPALPPERIVQVGNAAGVGVRAVLVSAAARERAHRLAARARHLELGSQPAFGKIFMRRIGFD
jgi:uncharacterized 2Fe-2S/4Fe-4S cluster protein (DUF4445 family)